VTVVRPGAQRTERRLVWIRPSGPRLALSTDLLYNYTKQSPKEVPGSAALDGI
jgi:hypothetical protein